MNYNNLKLKEEKIDSVKRAIVLGGTHDHIHLLELLKQKGYYTVLVDYYTNPIARNYADKFIKESTTNKKLILEIARVEKISLIIACCIDSALMTMVYVSEKLSLPCHISYSTAKKLTQKPLMKRIFKQNDILTSKFISFSHQNIPDKIELNYPLVIKPANANSSKGIKKIYDYNELHKTVLEASKFNNQSDQIIAEEFVEGCELSIDVLVTNGKAIIVLITESIKSKSNNDVFTIIESKYPVKLSKAVVDSISITIDKIVMAYQLKNTPLLIQGILSNERFYVIEFSARIGGGSKHHLIRKITGLDMVQIFIDLIHGNYNKLLQIQDNVKKAHLKYLYNDTLKMSLKQLEEAKDQKLIDDLFVYKELGSKIDGNIYSSHRICGVLLLDKSTDFIE